MPSNLQTSVFPVSAEAANSCVFKLEIGNGDWRLENLIGCPQVAEQCAESALQAAARTARFPFPAGSDAGAGAQASLPGSVVVGFWRGLGGAHPWGNPVRGGKPSSCYGEGENEERNRFGLWNWAAPSSSAQGREGSSAGGSLGGWIFPGALVCCLEEVNGAQATLGA